MVQELIFGLVKIHNRLNQIMKTIIEKI